MTAQHAAAVVGAQQHSRGKVAATTTQAVNIAHPETHYVQSNQVRNTRADLVLSTMFYDLYSLII